MTSGLTEGFAIGFDGPRESVTAPNLPSSLAYTDHISTYLAKCCDMNQTAGPFDTQPFRTMMCSGLGVVPKRNGGLRVIHHLSAPPDLSVNDHIDPAAFSLKYIHVDDAVRAILNIGSGALLSKFDIRNAFRLIPVRPDDWPLLGIHWRNQYYFDKVLPFGLRSSPFIFDKVASAIEWIVRAHFKVPTLFHYLDDFLAVAPPSLSLAAKQHSIIKDAFQYLEVPLAEEKLEGPTTSLTFLGITLDTVTMEARLPDDKLEDLRGMLSNLRQGRSITAANLDSFLGKLAFAASVVIPGRTFTRRLWDTAKRFHRVPRHYRIVLNDACRKDIQWWHVLLKDWNGKAFLLYQEETPATDLGLFTDASGAVGWGAYYTKEGRWMQGKWSAEDASQSIEFKELFAILMACNTWGSDWCRHRIAVHCDNKAIVDCLASGTSKSPPVMSLLRKMFMVCAKYNFTVVAKHVPGKSNCIADSLSRYNMQDFRRLAPNARSSPDIPPLLPSVE